MRSTGRLLALAGMLVAGPVAAQSGGTVELGLFGRWTKFGESLKTDVTNKLPAENGIGGGLRLGVFIIRNLEVEADASYTKVDAAGGDKVRLIPIHAGLTYNIPLGGKAAFLLGARYVRNMYGEDADFKDSGIGGVGGFRLGPLRAEATFDAMPKDDPVHGSYHNIGVNAGLSLLLGKGCNKSADGVTISPTSVTLERGQKTTFTATATHCGKPEDEVNWTATGGTISSTGEYTAGQTPGNYSATVTEPEGGLSASATVVIKEPAPPPPPPPPPVTLTRIDLKPDRAKAKRMEAVAFTVTGIMSDGSNKPLSNCPLTATGNPTQSGNSFSWSQFGTYTVTANCEGQSDQSTVEVPLEVVIFGANFRFDKDQLTAAGLDSVRAAADSLKKYPEIKVRLAGFADFMGSDAYNCNLSWRRVHTVHHALNRFGIPDERFTAIEGFGEAYPVPDDQVPQAWKDINTRTHDKGKWWDRRVDITSASNQGMTACAEPGKKP
jgi:outer membrane protein OmpA-like peptidoglycan-associated protein